MSLERAADFFTGHVWKFEIQYHHVGAMLSKTFESSDAVRGNFHGKPVRLKQTLQGSLHRAAIFDYQYRIHGFLWTARQTFPRAATLCVRTVALLYSYAPLTFGFCCTPLPAKTTLVIQLRARGGN